ncbi:MAG TPA: protein kinase [Kofleriaceae bacterium]|nr:protein kinase [Kofleriaceae bacterium]
MGNEGNPALHATELPPVAQRPKAVPEAFHATQSEPGADAGVAIAASPGQRVHHYELIRELGRGGMGVVWAARDTKLGRRVAIKFLRQASREDAERFLTEARATAQCNHDNIVIIHEVDELDDTPYMVLEFLEGQTLRTMMGPIGGASRLPATRVVELVLPIARALARAHEGGIIHRDLKPENVIVTTAGQVKVVDFGIAKVKDSRHDLMAGTLPYMSPEQLGMGEIDQRTDLWALGVMMWEMLAGRHPIEPFTGEALFANARNDTPMPTLRSAVEDAPDALAGLVDECLRKTHADRIANAGELVRRLEALAPGAGRATRTLAETESPYPGLTAFQEGDAHRFFGRARDIARITARIRDVPITALVGPSGVGKSSIVRAGVGPALKASGEQWDVVTLRPGRQPLAALATIVQRLTTKSGSHLKEEVGEHEQLVTRLRTEPGYVGTLLRARARQSGGHILLFVDQFEELYTLVTDAEERRTFTAALAGVADDTAAPLRVVLAMRSDLLDRVGEDARFMEELSRGLVFLRPPDREGLREALVAPVEMVGFHFESNAIVGDMIDALADTPGGLPLLQFAAAKLWDARDRDKRLLTVRSYAAIGGISGALATHADDVVGQMNAAAQKLTQQMFRRLVTPDRTRAIVELADLQQLAGDPAEVARTIDTLVAGRLLVVQTRADGGTGSVEIVHESLIDRWPTLRRWLDEDQEDAAFLAQLATAAKQWDAKGRPHGLLWRGDAMEEARRWHALRPRELPAREQAFLDDVFALARRGARAKRLALIVAFTVLGCVAIGAIVAAAWIRNAEVVAQQEKHKAQDALTAMEAKEAARKAAEAKQKAAEAQQQAALAEKHEVEEAKQKVEAAKEKAETAVAETAEELRKKNIALEQKIIEASTAKERALREKETAVAISAQLAKAKDELKLANDRLKEENERLKKEVLATKLK